MTAVAWDEVARGGSDFSMRFVHSNWRRDHRVVHVRGSDVDERLLQEAVYNFCDRVRIQQTESRHLRLEYWRDGELIGSHGLESFHITPTTT